MLNHRLSRLLFTFAFLLLPSCLPSLSFFTARFKSEPRITVARGRNVEVEPEIVIEVDFQDIQKTSRYAAGYVLRIPRFRRERSDKSTREADTLARLKSLYRQTH